MQFVYAAYTNGKAARSMELKLNRVEFDSLRHVPQSLFAVCLVCLSVCLSVCLRVYWQVDMKTRKQVG